MSWLDTLSAVPLLGGFVRGFATAPSDKPAPPAPTRKSLQTPEAYVDPSLGVQAWKIAPYNPSWLVSRRGLAIYDAMYRDEQVKAALKFKTDTALGSGWEVVSPAGEEEDWEVTRFARHALEHVAGGWQAVLVEMLTALRYGYSCAEKVYHEEDAGDWKGKLTLARLQYLKPHWVDFPTDEFGQLLAVRQVRAGFAQQDMPPEKFLIYSYAKEFGNHYGRSDLESAYRSWWVKDNAYKWLAVTLERFGMPPLFAMYDPNQYDARQIEELKKVVKGIQNATLGVLPRATPEALEIWSQQIGRQSSSLFLAALERFDQHISRGILVPAGVGMSSEGAREGSLARSQQHFDSFIRVVEALRAEVADTAINAQVIPQLCDLNYPNLTAYPVFRFLPFSDADKFKALEIWAGMVGGKVVNRIEDDEQHIRKVVGFPDNEHPVIEELPADAEAKAKMEAAKKGIAPGAPPFGGGGAGASRPGAAEAKAKPAAEPSTGSKGAVPKGLRKLAEEEHSAEMRAFAEEYAAVWVEAEGGERVAVNAAEWERRVFDGATP